MVAGSKSDATRVQYRVFNYCEAMCGIEVTYDPSAQEDKRIKVRPDID